MFLTAVSWSRLACFNEQQPYSCPYQFAQTDDESHKGSVAGFHSESGYGHEKSSFASSELQGNEEEEIGEKRGEGKYEYAVSIVGLRHEYAQDEVDFGCRADAACQLAKDGCHEGPGVLLVQRGYLAVDGVELLLVSGDKALGPSFGKGNVAQDVHRANGKSFAISGDEEP